MNKWIAPLFALFLTGCSAFGWLTPEENDLVIEQAVMRTIETASDREKRARQIETVAERVEAFVKPGTGGVLWGDLKGEVRGYLLGEGWLESDIRLILRILERRLPGAVDSLADNVALAPEIRAAILIDIQRVKFYVAEARIAYKLGE